MNRIDTDQLTWKGALLVFKALCVNVKEHCSNCFNCANLNYIQGVLK